MWWVEEGHERQWVCYEEALENVLSSDDSPVFHAYLLDYYSGDEFGKDWDDPDYVDAQFTPVDRTLKADYFFGTPVRSSEDSQADAVERNYEKFQENCHCEDELPEGIKPSSSGVKDDICLAAVGWGLLFLFTLALLFQSVFL